MQDVRGLNGIGQGGDGIGQGAIGSFVGQSTGPNEGVQRAATGGPNMEQGMRKPQGFLGFLGNIASIAAPFIPGVGGLVAKGVGALAGTVSGMQAQDQADKAFGAATGAQTGIAGELARGPQLDPLINQEKAGISSAVSNSNVANPGRLIADLFGSAITNAIGGVTQGRNQALGEAANIYSGVGSLAADAAKSVGNPFDPLATWAAELQGKTQGTGVGQTPTASGGSVATGAGSQTAAPSQPPPPPAVSSFGGSSLQMGLPGYSGVGNSGAAGGIASPQFGMRTKDIPANKPLPNKF